MKSFQIDIQERYGDDPGLGDIELHEKVCSLHTRPGYAGRANATIRYSASHDDSQLSFDGTREWRPDHRGGHQFRRPNTHLLHARRGGVVWGDFPSQPKSRWAWGFRSSSPSKLCSPSSCTDTVARRAQTGQGRAARTHKPRTRCADIGGPGARGWNSTGP